MTVRAFPHWDSATPWGLLGLGTPAPQQAVYSVVRSEVTGGTVSALSVYATSGPAFARDKTSAEWHSLNTSGNPWIMLDFGTAQNVSMMTIQQRTSTVHWFKDVLIEYSTDNVVWVPVYRLRVAAPAASVVHTVEFEPVTARYWRLRMTGLGSSADWYFVVQEWAVYGGVPVSRFVRRGDERCGLMVPRMSWIGAAPGTKVFWRGEYRCSTVNTLGGFLATDSADKHVTVPDQQWRPFQCSSLVDGDWAYLWASDPSLYGWIEFRNVVVDTDPMPMGWDGQTWKFITDTWDGTKWRADAEGWDGRRWLKLWESRVDPGGEQWSPWYEVKPYGTAVPAAQLANTAQPVAIFAVGWANYGEGNWATAKWRYSDRGVVECYGLVRATQAFTPVQAVILSGWLPANVGFTPGGSSALAMINCMSSHAPLPGTGTSMMRVDVNTSTTNNPMFSLAMTPNGSPNNINNGDWIGLNMHTDITQGDN